MTTVARFTVEVRPSLPSNGFNLESKGEKVYVNGMLVEKIYDAMNGNEGTAIVDVSYELNYTIKRHLSLYRAVGVQVVETTIKRKEPKEPVVVVAILPHQQRIARPKEYLTGRVEETLEGVIFTGRVAKHIVTQLGRPGGYQMRVLLRPYRGNVRNIDWEVSSMDQVAEELGRVHVSVERKRAGKPLE